MVMTGQMGDPARLRLLEFLLGAEHTVGECLGASAPQNRASAHLACLADCGYVQSHRAGRFRPQQRWPTRAAYNAEMLADHVRIAPATA
jgi:ArsR family transcriptional regulator, cadmium/lead-responsive transcriptional repressor